MNIMKKATSFLTAFLIIISSMTVSYAQYTDIKNANVEKAVSVLSSMGILQGYEDNTFRPDNTITRAEYAAVIARTLGWATVAQSTYEQTPFIDVPIGWASGYIKMAADSGIINGYGDGRFGPDDPVTYEQAVKILVSALGYQPIAEAKGGYPSGYIMVAADKKVTKDANGSVGEAAKRGVVAQLIYNALDVETMEKTGYGDETKYESTGDTLMSSKLNIKKKEGQVTANSYTQLYSSDSSLKEDEVEIKTDDDAGVRYKIGNTNANQLLGYQVDFYAYEDRNSGDEILFSILPQDNKNDVADVNAENIDDETDTAHFYYWKDKEKDNSTKNVDIAGNVVIIYNGKSVDTISEKYLKPVSGEVKLLDSDGDGQYDVIFVTDEKNLVVSSVDTQDNTLYFRSNKYQIAYIDIDNNSKDNKVSIIKDRKAISISDIKVWDVATVTQSEDGKLANIIISSEKISGTVSEAEKRDGDNKEYSVTINDKKYTVAADINDDINSDDEGDYYLNYQGKIAYVDTATVSSGEKYGYLMEVAQNTGVSADVQMKILTADNKKIVYKCADKVKYNDTTIKKDVVYNNLSMLGSTVIMYAFNGNGDISKIKTAFDHTSGANADGYVGYDENNFSRDYANDTAYYKYSNVPIVAGKYILDNNTAVFILDDNMDNYRAITYSGIISDQSYKVNVYDADSKKVAKVLVITPQTDYTQRVDLSMGESVVLVDKVTQVIKDDQKVYKLTGYKEGQKIEIYTDEDGESLPDIGNSLFYAKDDAGNKIQYTTAGSTLSHFYTFKEIKQGFVIQYTLNADNVVSAFRVLYAPNDGKLDTATATTWGTGTSDLTADLYTIVGTVMDVGDSSVSITLDQGSTNFAYGLPNARIYKLDLQRQKVSPANLSEILTQTAAGSNASTVFVRIYRNQLMDLVIIKR